MAAAFASVVASYAGRLQGRPDFFDAEHIVLRRAMSAFGDKADIALWGEGSALRPCIGAFLLPHHSHRVGRPRRPTLARLFALTCLPPRRDHRRNSSGCCKRNQKQDNDAAGGQEVASGCMKGAAARIAHRLKR